MGLDMERSSVNFFLTARPEERLEDQTGVSFTAKQTPAICRQRKVAGMIALNQTFIEL